MFLTAVQERRPELIKTVVDLHQSGKILPDTYILDLDQILENAQRIINEADQYHIKLYAMTKQFGRIPFVAQKLIEIGFQGIVAVDFKEAALMIDAAIPLGNVGHLVQIPKALMRKVLMAEPEIITLYSIEKAQQIDAIAKDLNRTQPVMLRLFNEEGPLYSGQTGGFCLDEIEKVTIELLKLKQIRIAGVTAFPCFLYNELSNRLQPTAHVTTLHQAVALLGKLGVDIEQVNMPSATSIANLQGIARHGGTHGEPGHALTGTTPYNAKNSNGEQPAMIYLSEVSHHVQQKAICFGGGHYRRSGMAHALVGSQFNQLQPYQISAPSMESIDYHFELDRPAQVGDTVIAAFRTQIFVTRSDVAVVSGISSGTPKIEALYNSLGYQK